MRKIRSTYVAIHKKYSPDNIAITVLYEFMVHQAEIPLLLNASILEGHAHHCN